MHRHHRRALLKGGLALAGCGLLSACGLPPLLAPRPKIWRLGLYHVGQDHVPSSLDPLRDELASLGYVEGTNLQLDWRNLASEANAQVAAHDFVRSGVDLIVAFENQTMRASKEATSTIPVVFLHVDDPVANGWVESLAHPGGNLTGATIKLCAQHRLPVTAHRKEFVADGALFSYGPDQATTGRAAARLIDKILKGARPDSLPVEQMDVLQLVVNLRVAQTLGLALPREVVAQADALIQ